MMTERARPKLGSARTAARRERGAGPEQVGQQTGPGRPVRRGGSPRGGSACDARNSAQPNSPGTGRGMVRTPNESLSLPEWTERFGVGENLPGPSPTSCRTAGSAQPKSLGSARSIRYDTTVVEQPGRGESPGEIAECGPA